MIESQIRYTCDTMCFVKRKYLDFLTRLKLLKTSMTLLQHAAINFQSPDVLLGGIESHSAHNSSYGLTEITEFTSSVRSSKEQDCFRAILKSLIRFAVAVTR